MYIYDFEEKSTMYMVLKAYMIFSKYINVLTVKKKSYTPSVS